MDKTKTLPAVFIRLADSPIPRVQRMMLVARELGFDPHFVGSYRQRGLERHTVFEGWEVERIGPFFSLLNGSRPWYYIASILRYWKSLYFHLRGLRPALIHVSDFEVFWPARLYAMLNRVPIVYNIHDNLALRYRVSDPIAAFLNVLEGCAVLASSVTLVPEEFRKRALPKWASEKIHVVRNAPVDPGYSEPNETLNTPVGILYAGWLDEGRGLRNLIDLVQRNQDMVLRVAGSGDAALVLASQTAERTEFKGYLSHKEIMEETAASDFVAALYEPSRPINRFAASNKVAEALAVGRPVIVNKELEIVRLLEQYDCAVFVDYDRTADIGPLLKGLRSNASRYRKMCLNARRAYEENYAWETIRDASVAVFQAAVRTMQSTVE
jgi:glycosyltransferase involved in cell wall biosynthesis